MRRTPRIAPPPLRLRHWLVSLLIALLTVAGLLSPLWLLPRFNLISNPTPNVTSVLPTQPPVRLSGRPVQMLYRLERDAAREGWTGERLWLAGDLWREAGDLRRAFSFWQAAMHTVDDSALLRDVAETAVQLRAWDVAQSSLDRLVNAEPANAWARLQRGILNTLIGRAEAITDLGAAAGEAAYLRFTQPLLNLINADLAPGARALRAGSALAAEGEWSYGELAFATAAEDDALPLPVRAEAAAAHGWMRAQLGLNPDTAFAQARAWASAEPGDGNERARSRVLLFEAFARRAQGDEAASLNLLQTAVALQSDDALLYAELGIGYSLLEDYETARLWLERAASLTDDPNQAMTFRTLRDNLAGAQADVEAALLDQLGLLAPEATDMLTPESTEDAERTPELSATIEPAATLDTVPPDQP